MKALSALVGAAVFFASASALAAISAEFVTPATDTKVYSVTTFRVFVSSTNYVNGVVLSAGGVSAPMVRISDTQFQGKLDTTSLPYGLQDFTATATNTAGETAVASRPYFVDNPPVVVIRSPADNHATNGDLVLDIECTDDSPGGCTSLKASLVQGSSTQAIATGTSSIVGSFPWQASTGTSVYWYKSQLQVVGAASAGPSTTLATWLNLDRSDHLYVEAWSPDFLFAFDGTRSLRMHEGASGVVVMGGRACPDPDEDVPLSQPSELAGPPHTFVVPTGGFLAYWTGFPEVRHYGSWFPGDAEVGSMFTLDCPGSYLPPPETAGGHGIIVCNDMIFRLGAEPASMDGRVATSVPALSPTGDVYYVHQDLGLVRFRDGALTALPQTGTGVLADGDRYAVTSDNKNFTVVTPGGTFALMGIKAMRDGWIFFSPNGTDLRRRSSAGAIDIVDLASGTPAKVVSYGDGGQVLVEGANKRLFLARPGAPTIDVAAAVYPYAWRGNAFRAAIGTHESVRVAPDEGGAIVCDDDPGGTPDAGVDAGTPDASPPDAAVAAIDAAPGSPDAAAVDAGGELPDAGGSPPDAGSSGDGGSGCRTAPGPTAAWPWLLALLLLRRRRAR